MIYEVVNKPNKIETVLLDSAVSFACSYLNLNVDFTIEFDSLKRHQCGICDYEEDEIVIFIAKRLSPKTAIRTLFHELVHVQQYESGRLDHNRMWEGTSYDCEYADRPWELEAFDLEEKMMKFFYG